MIKILTIIGARPQIIKAAAISREIKNSFSDKIEEVIVHTGQHYDVNMSQVFIDELGIPKPNYNLNVHSGSHGKQTASMISGIEDVLIKENPNYLLVYGDTNSTIAGALAASKMNIPVIHVEAGLRSYNREMPEEINRILTDHVSTLLFSPTQTGITNLVKEGFSIDETKEKHTPQNPGVYNSGDIMYDNTLFFKSVAAAKIDVLSKYSVSESNYILLTVHRGYNTDDIFRLEQILKGILEIANKGNQIIFPLHPRTSKVFENNRLNDLIKSVSNNKNIQIIPPVSFLEMTMLEQHAKLIITDSGGVQKEAYFFNKPCIILRPETEWIEILETGYAEISDANADNIIDSFIRLDKLEERKFPSIFGDGKASAFICNKIVENENK